MTTTAPREGHHLPPDALARVEELVAEAPPLSKDVITRLALVLAPRDDYRESANAAPQRRAAS
jgi:hypothetical protein